MSIQKKSKNIFIILGEGIWHFLKVSFQSIISLVSFSKIPHTKYSFLESMIETGPKHFKNKPTGIKIGRALFAPILYLLSQKKYEKNTTQK